MKTNAWHILFALCTMFGASDLKAYSYDMGGFSYPWYFEESWRSEYYGIENGAEITGCSEELTGAVTLPSHVSDGRKIYPVIGVDFRRYSSSTTLEQLAIGSGYRYIGSYCFADYTALSHVQLSEGLDEIGKNAFNGCTSLEQIAIPASVTKIGNGAFGGCSSLSSIDVSPGNLFYKSEDGLLLDKAGTTLFAMVGGRKTLNLPTSVTTIAERTFYSDESLTSIDIPYHVTNIEDAAFMFCDASKLTLANGVETIGKNAFHFCNNILAVKIPASVTSIGTNVFTGWGPRTYHVAQDNPAYRVENDIIFEKSGYNLVATPGGSQYLKFPYGVVSIPKELCGYTHCKEVSLPSSLKEIQERAFTSSYLTTVEIPDSVIAIGNEAFYSYSKLGSIVVGSGVISIGKDAFRSYYDTLTNVVFKGLPPEGFTNSAIRTKATICYPNRYATQWLAVLNAAGYTKTKPYTDISEVVPVRPMRNYWVSFDANGGTGSIATRLFTTSTIANLPVCTMEREGHEFVGWSLTDDGKVAFYDGEAVMDMTSKDSMTLYAVWEPSAYQVIFDANGGSGTMQPQQGVIGTDITLNLNQFTRTGYRFGGWATEAGGKAVYADGERVKDLKPSAQGTVTLYAVWVANNYTLRFHANGGTGDMPDQILTYDIPAAIVANQFVLDGYDFVGWATNDSGTVVWEDEQTICNVSAVHNDTIDAYAVWKEGTILWPIISPTNGTIFLAKTCEVSIKCLSEGATIYYTTNGTTPRIIDECKYVKPFTISDTTTIKAVCVKETMKSPYITALITQRLTTLAEAVDAPDLLITSDSASPWIPVFDNTAIVGGISARSGKLVKPKRGTVESAMEVSVQGSGELSFWWKVDCEHDDSGECTWDRLMYFKDGATEDEERIDGNTGWLHRTVTFSGEGTHTLKWVYLKDNYDDEQFVCQDCGWVDAVVWTPARDPIPDLGENPTKAQIQEVLRDFEDSSLNKNVGDGKTYNAFRNWALGLECSQQEVKDSPHAWLSFALDTDTLIMATPTQEDIVCAAISPSDETAGAWVIDVAITGVVVGDNVVYDYLIKSFGMQGAYTMDASAFSQANVTLQGVGGNDGKLRFVASPKQGSVGTFFMRVQLTP